MNKLSLLAATGLMALLLTACGENGTKKPDEKSDTATMEQTQPATGTEPAAATTTTTTTNTDGATSQE